MAVNSYDLTTGRPIFLDGDAPDIKVDPAAAALYAEEVGNQVVKVDLAALEAYPYAREGLSGIALDTRTEYLHDGSGWIVSPRAPYGINWRTVGQSIPDVSGDTKLTYDGTPVLRGGMTYASSGITVPLPGVYEVNVSVLYDVSPTGRRDAAFAVNGTVLDLNRFIGVASGSVSFLAMTRGEVDLDAGDTITSYGKQTSGANRLATGFLSVKMVTS